MFEKAILLEVNEENVRIWTDCCRMRDNEFFDTAKEVEEISELFAQIARIIREKILPEGYRKPDFVWTLSDWQGHFSGRRQSLV